MSDVAELPSARVFSRRASVTRAVRGMVFYASAAACGWYAAGVAAAHDRSPRQSVPAQVFDCLLDACAHGEDVDCFRARDAVMDAIEAR